MRWEILWLTAVMIAATSAVRRSEVITVENIQIGSVDPDTTNGITEETPAGSESTTDGSTHETTTGDPHAGEGCSTTTGGSPEGGDPCETPAGSEPTTEGSTYETATGDPPGGEGCSATTGGSPEGGDPCETSAGSEPTTEGSTVENTTGDPPGGEDDGDPPGGEDDGDPPGGEDDGDPPGGEDDGDPPGGEDDGDPPGGEDDGDPPGGEDDGDPPGGEDDGDPPGGEDDGDPPGGEGDGDPPGGEDDGDLPGGGGELIVKTNSGKVQGFLWQGEEDIISYIDIPYGTITNIFQPATAATPWVMHSVSDHNKRCPQIQDNKDYGNVDCLTLSIFKKRNAENASVLFYIHGDDFKTGSGDPLIYGPDYLVNNGIILVLPNYRLGPLGFLCMQNKTAPGNMALKDLSLALSWIHDNIQFFGGYSDNIVVSGDGRSGALAELLALSPMSKDHVHKVISESGSLLSHWALDRNPKSTAAAFFDRIQEAEKSIKSRIDISLDDIDLGTIVNAGKEIEFKPCLEAEDEDAFLTKTPYATITTKKIETTFLMGSAMYAGFHEALHHTEDSIKELNEDVTLLLPNDLTFPTWTLKAETGGRVKKQYFGDQNITLDNVRNISLYFTDVGYIAPAIRSARLLAEAGATVYFYEFSFVGKFNRELESLNSPEENLKGAVRGDIVGYLFTQDGHVPDAEDTDDIKMVDTLTEMWTNFLTKGHPGTETIEWNKLESKNHDEEEWLLIDSDQPSMQKGLHVDRLRLWTNIYEAHYIEGGNHARGLAPSVLTILIFQLVFWLVFCRNVSHVF